MLKRESGTCFRRMLEALLVVIVAVLFPVITRPEHQVISQCVAILGIFLLEWLTVRIMREKFRGDGAPSDRTVSSREFTDHKQHCLEGERTELNIHGMLKGAPGLSVDDFLKEKHEEIEREERE